MPRLTIGLAVATAIVSGPAQSAGYLAERPEKLPVLELGLGDAGFGVSQKDYNLITGKAYALTIRSTGRQECAWEAPEFMNFVWLRKVEVAKIEIKATHLYEIEMEREGEAEIYLVPIRPGEYAWRCRGLQEKGMAGRFIVK